MNADMVEANRQRMMSFMVKGCMVVVVVSSVVGQAGETSTRTRHSFLTVILFHVEGWLCSPKHHSAKKSCSPRNHLASPKPKPQS